MADNLISASKARPSIETEDSSSFTSQTNTSVKAEHVSSASIPTTPVSPSFKLQMCEIDLSEYQSDGTYQKPVQIQLQYRSNDTILLNELTCEFNRGHHVAALGFWANASVDLPMDMLCMVPSSTVTLMVLQSRTSIWPNMSSV
ncbi:hypothetical protein VTO58DRAFT_108312 [Aureobasidium pullulans]